MEFAGCSCRNNAAAVMLPMQFAGAPPASTGVLLAQLTVPKAAAIYGKFNLQGRCAALLSPGGARCPRSRSNSGMLSHPD